MGNIPKRLVVSGELLMYCIEACSLDLFGGKRSAELESEFDERSFLAPKTWDDSNAMERLIRTAMRKDWVKRPTWVARHRRDLQYFAYCSLLLSMDKIEPAGKYQVSPRWISSLVQTLGGIAWPAAKRGDVDAWLPELVHTSVYLGWLAQGGHPDLGRWIVCFHSPELSES